MPILSVHTPDTSSVVAKSTNPGVVCATILSAVDNLEDVNVFDLSRDLERAISRLKPANRISQGIGTLPRLKPDPQVHNVYLTRSKVYVERVPEEGPLADSLCGDFPRSIQGHMHGRGLPKVLEVQFNMNAWRRGVHCDLRCVNSHPGTFIKDEVTFKIFPLEIRNKRTPDGSENPKNLQAAFPLLKGLIPWLIGVAGMHWGWINLTVSRRLPLSGIVFVASIPLVSYGFLVLPPWSVRGG